MSLVLLVAAGVGGLALVSWFFRDENLRRRRMARAPRTPIEHAKAGLAYLRGEASRAADVLVAPVSGRPCLAFVLTVFEEGESGTTPLARLRQARPFWLDDGTGRALVEPGSHFDLVASDGRARISEPSMPETVVRGLRQLLRDWGVTTEVRAGARRILHYDEAVIVEGPSISVGGHANFEMHPHRESGGGRPAAAGLVLRGRDASDPLLIASEVVRG